MNAFVKILHFFQQSTTFAPVLKKLIKYNTYIYFKLYKYDVHTCIIKETYSASVFPFFLISD